MPHPRRIGYVRISTPSQLHDRQVLQLEAHCDDIRIETISAVASGRPVFDQLLEELREGDTFVVLDIDRAFRSAIDAITTAGALDRRGIHFEVLNFPIDTSTDEGEFLYGVLALAAQLERKTIKRRTKEGLAAARQRGVKLGRPAQLDKTTVQEAHEWMCKSGLPCRYVAALLGVSRLTLQRSFHRQQLAYPIPQNQRGRTNV